MVSRTAVAEHNTCDNCWIIISGVAYDVTKYIDKHPGGSNIILRFAGKDATEVFRSTYPSDALDKHLGPEQNLGRLDDAAQDDEPNGVDKESIGSSVVAARQKKVPLQSLINLNDFEVAASKVLDPKAFAFYRAAADDELSFDWNRRSWKAIRFRPRIFRPLYHNISLQTNLLGVHSGAPFFIAPAGGGKYAHPDGEVHLTTAAAQNRVIQWVSNAASCSQAELMSVKAPKQPLFWQIYGMKDLTVTEKEIRNALELGFKAFAFTVDAIVMGNRERDAKLNLQISREGQQNLEDDDDSTSEGGISATRPSLHPHFNWDSAIEWLRAITDLPIAIKGIQTWEDAQLCLRYPGVHPWLSNHGGRQLEGAPSAVDTLLEMQDHCREVFKDRHVIVDGGIMRGTDIVKALCLGATAIGIGRPFLYSLAYGEKGASRTIKILKREVETTMALLGVSRIKDLNPSYIDTSGVQTAFASLSVRSRL